MAEAPLIAVEPAEEIALKVIGDGLSAFNRQASNHARDSVEFLVTARDSAGQVLGGAYCAYGTGVLFIKWLWLDERVRGGAGSKVMTLAEQHARSLGASVAYLDTFTFQARGFYEKLGYSVFGTLDYPVGDIQRFWMQKRLVD